MAHKKAGGSSRNGRDSGGRRLGVKKFGGELAFRAIFLCVNAERNSIRAVMSASERTTPSLQLPKADHSGQAGPNLLFVDAMPMAAE